MAILHCIQSLILDKWLLGYDKKGCLEFGQGQETPVSVSCDVESKRRVLCRRKQKNKAEKEVAEDAGEQKNKADREEAGEQKDEAEREFLEEEEQEYEDMAESELLDEEGEYDNEAERELMEGDGLGDGRTPREKRSGGKSRKVNNSEISNQ